MQNTEIQTLLLQQEELSHLGNIETIELIQKLWSDYGELLRVKLSNKSIIVKYIKLPHLSKHRYGWNTNISYKRKLNSYKVELNWYGSFSKAIDERCRIPQVIKTIQKENEFFIIMEDLKESGYELTLLDPSQEHIASALSWLANFHARYMCERSDLIWKSGTYWHLQTRPDELEVLQDKELKDNATLIDEVLKNTKYQTIVHGDAKVANFCFTRDGTKAAAVDFQYVGHGCGMKDLAYFMSSAVEPERCEQMQEYILDSYFIKLKKALSHYQPNIDSIKLEQEWRPLFEVAWADFQRFVKGWNPNHYKINPYTDSITKKALKYLDSSNPARFDL